ncbi:E3 ubiquitin ligase family protein [Goodfellowiella coeruleoviolacea]|uniref:RING-type E3 ubiquitin transferase n=1 Tax=Goodfellowiella coeruleoviolacea TaxID=334858 RepID=A0AAE3KIW6_9PSEU|nr:E3 ubiquitin ligase family protein [Goodfellowiella coeruleoviolacea]MCP2168920.1 E3 Ubiquitin ligase [Goodfellowiella coeruleoviolacea]
MVIWGIILIVAGVAGFFMAHSMRRDLHALIGAETLKVAELGMFHSTAVEVSGPGGFRKVCEVIGAAEPGPNGMLVSELSKTPCVWHRHEVKRRYRHVRYDSDGRRHTSQRSEKVADLTSDQPILVRDETGAVLVHPSGLRSDAMEQVVSRFEPHNAGGGPSIFGFRLDNWNRDDTIGFEYKEWVVRPGVRLYVHGEASDQTGQLMFNRPQNGGPFIASTKTEEELRRNTTLLQKVFAFGGLAAMLGGLALVIVGVIQ